MTITAGLAALAFAITAAGPAAAAARRSRFRIPPRADQVIVVSAPNHDPADYLAMLHAYQRAGPRSPWRLVFGGWPAETGYGHLRDVRRERDGSTPTGVYAIGATMYGVDPRPSGLHYAYHRLACGDWWDEDPYSADYNRFVHVSCGVTPGSGIFLHSWVGGPTAGCVALSRARLLAVLRWLEPSTHPVIAIGTDGEIGIGLRPADSTERYAP